MSHWIQDYFSKEEFESHITDEWEKPKYKSDTGPIEIQNKFDDRIRIIIVNAESTVGNIRISIEMGGPFEYRDRDLPSHSLHPDSLDPDLLEFVEHFSENYENLIN